MRISRVLPACVRRKQAQHGPVRPNRPAPSQGVLSQGVVLKVRLVGPLCVARATHCGACPLQGRA